MERECSGAGTWRLVVFAECLQVHRGKYCCSTNCDAKPDTDSHAYACSDGYGDAAPDGYSNCNATSDANYDANYDAKPDANYDAKPGTNSHATRRRVVANPKRDRLPSRGRWLASRWLHDRAR